MTRRRAGARMKQLARERAPVYVEPVEFVLLDDDFDPDAEARQIALGTTSRVFADRRREF